MSTELTTLVELQEQVVTDPKAAVIGLDESVFFPPRPAQAFPFAWAAIAVIVASVVGQFREVGLLSRCTVGVASFCLLYIAWYYRRYYALGLIKHVQGTDTVLSKVLSQCPALQRGPRPPIWCASSHLQFVPFMVLNALQTLINPIQYQRVEFVVHARKVKDADEAFDPEMDETISVDIWPPLSGSGAAQALPRQAPVLLVAPGLRCHSHDIPGTTMVRWAHGQGLRTIVMNRRGHNTDAALKAPRFNLFGDIDDMEQVYNRIRQPDLLGTDTPIFLVGVSSGSALAVSGCGQWDARRAKGDLSAPCFAAAVAVCPGYDLTTCMGKFPEPYQSLLLKAIKMTFLERNASVLSSFDEKAYNRALASQNMQEFVDECYPFAGYSSSDSYYAHCNPVLFLKDITTPMLVLTAEDDPCCLIGNVHEESPYDGHANKSYSRLVAESQRGVLALTRSGSHCPFLDGVFLPFVRDPLGRGPISAYMQRNWADVVILEWCKAWLKENRATEDRQSSDF